MNTAIENTWNIVLTKYKSSGSTSKTYNGPYRDNEDSTDDDSDDESEEEYTPITGIDIQKKDLVNILINLNESNYIFDLGCKLELFLQHTSNSGNTHTRKCLCPFSKSDNYWLQKSKVESILNQFNVKLCTCNNFKNPFSFWNHVKSKATNCIFHTLVYEYITNLYGNIVKCNKQYCKVSYMGK